MSASVLSFLYPVTGFFRFQYDKAVIDNLVFRAHYKFTSAILFSCCLIASAYNLLGDPISCISDSIPVHAINTYCWITGTFSLPDNFYAAAGKQVLPKVAHPGLGIDTDPSKRLHHNYYQWVPFALFFQGLLFYLPHWLWKNWEEGKVKMISEGMRGVLLDTKNDRSAKINRLVHYIISSMHLRNTYAVGYFFCEVLNFVNVIANIFLVDKLLGGAFLNYGLDVIRFSNMDQESITDPMIKIFPRVTKCTFHKYGSSGSIVNHDALCILALNVINEKIYIFLWFWFIILAVITGVSLIYSMTLVLFPYARKTILLRKFKFASPDYAVNLIRKLQVGDFLLIYLLGQNMNMFVFNELLDELCRQLHLDSGKAFHA